LQPSDAVVTGADGSAGIAFIDNSLLSVGPETVLDLERYAFDFTTYNGVFEGVLRKGTMALVSGKIAEASPEAMKFRTPVFTLAVHGAGFVVRASDGIR